MRVVTPRPRLWEHVFLVLVSSLCLNRVSLAQTPAPAPARPRPAVRSTVVFVHVRNSTGSPLASVHVIVSGAAKRDIVTDDEGVVRLQSMADGAYHLRFESTGFVPLERDLTLKGGLPDL